MDVRIEAAPMSAGAEMLSVSIVAHKVIDLVTAVYGRVASFPRHLFSQGSTSLNAVSPDLSLAMEVGAV